MTVDDSVSSASSDGLELPLRVESALEIAAATIPVSVGIPLPRGEVREPFTIATANGTTAQTAVLDRWPDGSVRWALADFLLPQLPAGVSEILLIANRREEPRPEHIVAESETAPVRLVGPELTLDFPSPRAPKTGGMMRLRSPGGEELAELEIALHSEGKKIFAEMAEASLSSRGPVRAEVVGRGRIGDDLRIRARVSFWPAQSLLRLRLTLRNPRPARHQGGLWDLGDPGSILFDALDVTLRLAKDHPGVADYHLGPGGAWRSTQGPLHLYQDSSGGQNWNSPNHVNASGVVPCRFRGFELHDGTHRETGSRASPVVSMRSGDRRWVSAMPEFWQKFPKGVRAGEAPPRDGLTWELFPDSWSDRFELQGGERATHDLWLKLECGDSDVNDELTWVQRPPRVVPSPELVRRSRVVPVLDLPAGEWDPRLEELLNEKLEGERSFFACREIIDEYGWRHYGDLWADHEDAHFEGPGPVISHYNNQYDVLYGFLLQSLRTGDSRWLDLGLPLARHVMDIDTYHTTRDRPAYSGGLFWHTDHYAQAATASHRSYSRQNVPPGQPYGGGPSNEHNYTSGLLLLHYLTGDPDAAEAVRGLAGWVHRMDRERPSLGGRFISTGLASKTRDGGFHGPGRGAGNSINALLDAWHLDGDRRDLAQAEALIRRCIHPHDDLDALRLLDIENRWSYTVFLGVLVRFLELKATAGEIDHMYGYARACLVHYALWMAEHESPYLDRKDEVEYPTETWAAQDLRKSNVLFAAARCLDPEPAQQLRKTAQRLSARSWEDLLGFPGRDYTRPVAILMTEGLEDSRHRSHTPEALVPHTVDPGHPSSFRPLRERLRNSLRALRRLLGG